jgi:hypothetical protein
MWSSGWLTGRRVKVPGIGQLMLACRGLFALSEWILVSRGVQAAGFRPELSTGVGLVRPIGIVHDVKR